METKAVIAEWNYECPCCKRTVTKGSKAVERWESRGNSWERTVAHPECQPIEAE